MATSFSDSVRLMISSTLLPHPALAPYHPLPASSLSSLSYCGAQIFEIYGLGPEVVTTAFKGTVSRIGGLTLDEVSQSVSQSVSEAIHSTCLSSKPAVQPSPLRSFSHCSWSSRPPGLLIPLVLSVHGLRGSSSVAPTQAHDCVSVTCTQARSILTCAQLC